MEFLAGFVSGVVVFALLLAWFNSYCMERDNEYRTAEFRRAQEAETRWREREAQQEAQTANRNESIVVRINA